MDTAALDGIEVDDGTDDLRLDASLVRRVPFRERKGQRHAA